MNLLIGSRALAHWDSAFNLRPDADWDVISKEPIEGTEWHPWDFLNNSEFWYFAADESVELPNGNSAYVVDPIGLAIIKRSHLWRDVGFGKHITHWHKHLKQYSVEFDKDDLLVLENRIKLTKKEFPQGNPNLNQSVENFFDDAVEKKYNHDYLHSLFAYHNEPLYKSLQEDQSKAWCSLDLWDKLSYDDKLKCVAEEAYVISTERFLVPSDWKASSKLAFIKSCNKICTTLCSGWFRDFAIDEYPQLLNMYDPQKFNNVKQHLERM